MRRIAVSLGIAASGWVALAATALPAANPLRVLLVTAFLVLGPGAAAVRLAGRPGGRRDRTSARLETGVLTVAVSLSLSALVAEGFFLSRDFSVHRALGVLAGLTTLLALLAHLGPRRRRPGPAAGTAPAGPGAGPAVGGGDPPGVIRRSGRAAAGRRPTGAARIRPGGRAMGVAGAAGLLLTAGGCGSRTGAPPSALVPAPVRATPATPAATAGPAAPGSWHLVFQDDFNGTVLDPSRWTTCYDWNLDGCTNAGNHESEWYLPGQVSVGGGVLSLTAVRRTTRGSNGDSYPWRSGMVSTGRDHWDGTPRHTFNQGYFAAAIRVPSAEGLFPAFWLMPDTRTTPPEIDIAEFAGTAPQVQLNVHWAGPGGADRHQQRRYGPVDVHTGYHVFALDWESNSLTWYVDGVSRYRVTDHVPDVPMELLLNLAVGYPMAPAASLDSAVMKVDWVRVWQH